jgi:hypothetical protein
MQNQYSRNQESEIQMNYSLTIPIFSEGDLANTVIEIPQGTKSRLIRTTGAATVRIHSVRPLTNADQDKGWPIGANSTDNELGEALPTDELGAPYNALWATATAASQLRVMTQS